MAIGNVGSVVAVNAVRSGASAGPSTAAKFAEALAQAATPGSQGAAAQNVRPAPATTGAGAGKVDVVARLAGDQRRMDDVLALAQSGKSFSPAELLALQTQVYRSSQQLDLAGKVVEKTTGGVKQVLQTQL
jgi:hypothetical protein